jgi:hypothetical protein
MSERFRRRPSLSGLIVVLDAALDALRRDEFGEWSVVGRHGELYAAPGGFYVVLNAGDAPAWPIQRATLGFCETVHDRVEDGVGLLRLSRMPTDGEAALLRRALGIDRAMAEV